MSGRLGVVVSVATCVMLTGVGAVAAQVTSCFGPSCLRGPTQLAAELRPEAEQGRSDSRIVTTLLQLGHTHPPEALEELADSLMAVGIDLAEVEGPHGFTIGTLSANALATAAMWVPGPDEGGVAMPTAAARSVEVAHHLPDGIDALIWLRPILGDELWMTHLRRFAISDLDPSAVMAIVYLEEDNSSGLAVLRALFDDGTVTEPRAAWRLREIARFRGWSLD